MTVLAQGMIKMAKPKRASLKELPKGTQLSFLFSEVSAIYEDEPDDRGRLSTLKEHAGQTVVMVVLKNEKMI